MQEQLIERYGVGVVRRGGLRIHTTINPALQDSAREAINSYYGDPAGPSSRARADRPVERQDPGDGVERDLPAPQVQPGRAGPPPARLGVQDVRAHRGDPAGRRPGPHLLHLEAAEHRRPRRTGTGRSRPSGTRYIGTVSLTRATLSSDNTVYAQLILDLGPKKVCETAKLLGITTKLDCYPAEGLGGLTLGVTPLEMAGAYATLASGRHPSPPDGDQAGRVPGRQVREPRQRGGQARAHRRRGVRGHQDPRDERASRAPAPPPTTAAPQPARPAPPTSRRTPGSSATRPSSQPPCGSATQTPASPCRARQGGTYAAPVWHAFMIPAHGDYCDDFPEPTEPAEFSPFFGKYSSTGSARQRPVLRAEHRGRATRRPSSSTTRASTRRRRSTRPRPRRLRSRPPEAPVPGNGNGNGNGNGSRTAPPHPADAGPVAELELIAAIEATLSDRSGRLVRWTGDDAAVTRARPFAVTSIDTLVDGVHFERATHSRARHRLEGARHRALGPGGHGSRGRRGVRLGGAARGLRRTRSSWWRAWRSSRRAAGRRSRAATWCAAGCSW